ncbi:Uncharacterized protein FKW44_025070, partial [Caligus rogercresseyi]
QAAECNSSLSPKQRLYLKRQFMKLKTIQPEEIVFLANEVNCPPKYIRDSFARYKEFTTRMILTTSSMKDPLEITKDEAQGCTPRELIDEFDIQYDDEESIIVDPVN